MSGATNIHQPPAPWPCLAVIDELCDAFDKAKWADPRRRIEATGRLRRALADARALGDFGGMPFPHRIWVAAMSWLEVWAEASDLDRLKWESVALSMVTAMNAARGEAKAALAEAASGPFSRADIEGR